MTEGCAGAGIGALLLAEAERLARDAGARLVVLAAQTYARAVLRARTATVAVGPPFMDAGIEHVRMDKALA